MASPTPKVPEVMSVSQFDSIIFTLFGLSVVTTALRLYTRGIVLRAIGLDDILAVLATVLAGFLAVFHHLRWSTSVELFEARLRDPRAMRSPEGYRLFRMVLKWAYLNGMAYGIGLAVVKLAILAFYRRIAVAKSHRYALYVPAACVLLFMIGNGLAKVFELEPTNAAWDIHVPIKRARINPGTQGIVNSAFQIAFDLIILLLPVPILIKLHTNRRVKVGLGIVFSLGLLSLSMTVVRLVYSVRATQTSNSSESFRRQPILSIWTEVEYNTAILCANLPAISALLRGFRKPKASSGNTPHSYEKGGAAHHHHHQKRSAPDSSESQTTMFGQDGISTSSVSAGGTKDPYIRVNDDGSGITRTSEFQMDIECGGGTTKY